MKNLLEKTAIMVKIENALRDIKLLELKRESLLIEIALKRKQIERLKLQNTVNI